MIITHGNLKINHTLMRLYKNDNWIHLSFNQYRLMYMLMASPSRKFSRQEIQERVWGVPRVHHNAISQLISSVRDELGEGAIETVTGYGYMMGPKVGT